MPWVLVNDGSLARPLTTAPHEFGHSLGLPHADGGLVAPGDTGGCGGGKNGQVAEPWPPDGNGRLQGVKWDGAPHIDTDASKLFDLMSYCGAQAGDDKNWLSARNWNHVMNTLQTFDARQRAKTVPTRAAQAGTAFASGVVGPGAAKILHVFPADSGNLVPASDPGSDLKLRAFDAGGGQLAEVGAHVQMLHNHADPVGVFTAPVPAGATAVEAVSDGNVVDRVAQSHPPTVRVLAPRHGAGVGKSLNVRWAASDPDGDRLLATVEYSPNGRSGWQTIFTGEDAKSATVPGGMLAASDNARVRVTVNDAFGQARAVSAPFHVAGSPPTVRIDRPAAGEALQAGVEVQLIGSALDDHMQRLPKRALTWFANSKRLGSGEQLRVTLPVGRVELRLVARDRLGRETTAARTVQVAPIPLRIDSLRAPDKVRRGARTLAITISTTTPGLLRARGTKALVGTRARRATIALPARPLQGVLKVPVAIVAQGPRQSPVRFTLYVLRA